MYFLLGNFINRDCSLIYNFKEFFILFPSLYKSLKNSFLEISFSWYKYKNNFITILSTECQKCWYLIQKYMKKSVLQITYSNLKLNDKINSVREVFFCFYESGHSWGATHNAGAILKRIAVNFIELGTGRPSLSYSTISLAINLKANYSRKIFKTA